MTGSARQNVRGNNGPDRREVPNYDLVGRFSDNDFDALRWCVKTIMDHVGPTHNDINDPHDYQIAQDCPLKTYFPSTYRQILIQKPLTNGVTEQDYIVTREFPENSGMKIMGHLRRVGMPCFYRARLAIIPPGGVLDWHIDTNTSVSCRVHIPIFGESHWQIKRGDVIEQKTLVPGEVWFTNTGYSHRVENTHPTEDRVSLILGCRYYAIGHIFE